MKKCTINEAFLWNHQPFVTGGFFAGNKLYIEHIANKINQLLINDMLNKNLINQECRLFLIG